MLFDGILDIDLSEPGMIQSSVHSHVLEVLVSLC